MVTTIIHVNCTYGFAYQPSAQLLQQDVTRTRPFGRRGADSETQTFQCDLEIGKSSPVTGPRCPQGSRNLRFPDYMTMAQDGGKVVSLMHRLPLPPGNTPGTHLCWRLSRPQGHSVIGRIMSMKNSNDTIWNRTSNFLICSAAP